MECIKGTIRAIARFWLISVFVIGIGGAWLSNSGNPLGTNVFEGAEKSRPDSRMATSQERDMLRKCDRMQKEGWGMSAECKKLLR